MIAKIIRGTDFVGTCFYAMQEARKRAEVLAANGVRTGSAGEMAADFELQRSARPGLRQAMEHIALAWLPQETEKLTNEVMVRAAMGYMEERAIDPANTQWALMRHHDQKHPHGHLLLNRVTDDGQVLPDKHSHRHSAAACRKVEAAMGFVDAAQLGAAAKLRQAVQAELPEKVAERVQFKDLIRRALEKHLPTATTVRELQETLATEGVRMKATLQQGNQLQSAVFEAVAYPGLHVKGSEMAREYSGVGLRKTLEKKAEHREATTALAELRTQPAPTVPESPAALSPTQLASATSLESILPVVPRQVVATPAEGSVGTAVAPIEAGKQLPPASIQGPASVPAPATDRTPTVPLPERNVQLPVPIAGAVLPPSVVAGGPPEVSAPPVGLREATESTTGRSPLGPTVPADPPAPVQSVEAVVQQPRSEPDTLKQVAAIPQPEVFISGTPALLANAVGTAPGVVNEATWQHGIIRMLATERTSEARLSAVRAALVTAGATVGEIVPPTPGRNTLALLPYSFDPASTTLEEVNKVLRDVQALYDKQWVPTSKVQEQQHSLHQPGSAVEADNLKWPEREGQFNQAQILVNDPVRGQVRANKIADHLRSAGASVGEIKRDDQGLLTMQVHYHTCAPDIDAIDTVLAQVASPSVIGIEVEESQQNKDARYKGVILVAEQKGEKNANTKWEM